MRNTNVKNNKKFLVIIVLCLLALMTGVFALNFGGTRVYAHAAEIEYYNGSELEQSVQNTFSNLNGNMVPNQAYLSAHYADGTMGMVVDNTFNPDEVIFESFSFTHLQRSTVRSSGRPDNQSIVAVFLGEGFTEGEQQTFLDRVTEIANYMITVEPFNYYKDYLTVYAVHSISTDSGVSGEAGGAFACRNASGNPATPQCTPVDSAVFNCTHGKDTFYHSYYQWRSSANRVILEMASTDRARARNHALAASSSVNMLQIITNSAMRGGTGQMPTSSQPLGVALTSTNHANPSGDWKEVTMHEFGHAFGGLWDEYWNGITPAEYPNMTQTSSTTTVKWSEWVDYKSVGAYPFAASEWDGNPNQATNPWFRPHQNCMMRQTSNPFCPVCIQEILGRMATATGLTLFNTTNISTNNIRIERLNISVSDTFNIPERINGRIVTEIGSSAFASAGMSQITIPASVTNIGNAAFKNCFNLTSVSSLGNVQNLGTEVFSGCNALTNIAIPSSLTNIGEKAFAGCNNLNVSAASSNPNYSAQNNVIYNKAKTILISAHKISAEISILNTVTEISPYAFENNHNLYKVYFNNNVTIGEKAFANNLNLSQVYFYSFNIPTLGVNSFSGNDFTLFVPYNNQAAYSTLFGGYTNSVTSAQFQVNYISNNETVNSENIYYGSTINLSTPQREGYDLDGWYNNNSFSGEKYQNGDIWTIRNNQNIYAKWNAKSYTVTLNSNDGVLNGSNIINVTYDQAFSTPTMASRIGYTFEGWYDSQNGGTKYITESGQGTRLWDKTSNTTLYARWAVKSYEIKINDNGSITWLGASGLSDEQCSIEYGTALSAINLIATFKQSSHGFKEGKIFDHFVYDGSNFNWTSIPDLGEDGAIVIIIPVWVLEVNTIYFNTQSSISVNAMEANYDANIQLPAIVNRAGYNFTGWYTAANGGTKIVWTTMPDLTPNTQNNGSTQLYAYYTTIPYTITYYLDGGANNSNNPFSYNIESVISFQNPTKNGYNFVAWFTNADKTEKITLLSNSTDNKNIYAKWSPMSFAVSLNAQGGIGGSSAVTAAYNSNMPNANAPTRSGYAFDGYWTGTNGTGTQYYKSNMSSSRVWNMSYGTTLYAKWIGTYTVILRYRMFNAYSGNSNSNMFTNLRDDAPRTLLCDRSFSINVSSTYNQNSPFLSFLVTDNVSAFGFKSISSEYFYTNGTTVTFNANNNALFGKTIYAIADYEEPVPPSCVAEGTLITLADGSQKAVELLTGNEQLLVWNLKTGAFDTAPILFIDSDPSANYEVINLYFSDGTTVKVISEHGFWNIDLNKYVFLRNDAAQYLGHWFNKQITDANGNMTWTAVQLTNVVVANEVTTSWSPVTYEYLCYYVNGMLSMPGGTTGLINIFEVDAETMQYDQELMLAYIEEFGLFTYEEFAEILPVPQEIFDAFDAQYLKVAIGKGLIDWDTLANLIENYSKFFNA